MSAPVNASDNLDPIAIIGIGCRFPGGVHDLESFWQLLVNGVDAITEIPPDRFDVSAFYDARPATPGKIMTRWGGFLDHLDEFDPAAFKLAPREAERLDPQQRLLLETAWHALENAGQTTQELGGSQTGVFVGMWLSDFEARLFDDPSRVDFYMTTGSGRYSASGRLSYTFGLQGPSITIDTACSSSLVAVHLACHSLRTGESALALAGAANVILQPHITIAYSQSQMMAPDGRCKFGDARANGYVRSEGAAVIVLKRLADALADGDPIHALILGSAVNNDGQTSGYLTTPGGAGQEEMLRQAYANAHVSPGEIQYVEAHGTGTAAGDPVEIGAVGAVLAEGRAPNHPCRIGSVKTNLGHTESVAGLAGLIKVVLAMQHKQIPPSLHVQSLNPNIAWDKLPVRIQRERGVWETGDRPMLAGVSAFGIAGTNAHVVLQQAPMVQPAGSSARQPMPYILPLSAQTPEALRAFAQTYQEYLNADDVPDLRDICYTASARRSHHDYRLGLVAESRAQFIDQLDEWLQGGHAAQPNARPRKIVFVFPGQGSQWIGMGRQLLAQEPVFRDVIMQCDQAIRKFADWSLLEQLADATGARFDEIDVIQPVLFAVEIALAALWRSWGIEPEAVIGHSMGEVAAAYVAGALSLDDAVRVICRRSQLMKRVSGKGAMAVVELGVEEARAALQGYANQLSIAVSNSPRSTVIAGDRDALTQVVAELQKRDVFCRMVKVDVAAHSPQMEPLRPQLVASLEDIQPQSPAIPIYSTVAPHQSVVFDADYWGRNLREPVLFSTATRRAMDDGLNTFIEMSPHPILLSPIQETADADTQVVALPLMRREENERAVMLSSLGELYARGCSINWRRIYADGRVVSLPAYPFQRERYWVDQANPRRRAGIERPTRLLSAQIELAASPRTHLWNVNVNLQTFPYLADHRVRGKIVLPASAFVEMALEAAFDVYGSAARVIEKTELVQALVSDETPIETQFILVRGIGDAANWRVQSRLTNTSEWTLNARGTIRERVPVSAPNAESIENVRMRMTDQRTNIQFYASMTARGLEYGDAFQGVVQCARNDGEALSQIQLPPMLVTDDCQIHPAILDACFQSLVATLRDDEWHPVPYLPTHITKFLASLPVRGDSVVLAHAVRHARNDEVLEGDVFLRAENGETLGVVTGLRLEPLKRDQRLALDDLMYRVEWTAEQKRADMPRGSLEGNWLVFADADAVGKSLAEKMTAEGARCVLVAVGGSYRRIHDKQYEIDPQRAEDYHQILRDALAGQPCRGIVYLWAIAENDALQICANTLRMVQAIAQSDQASQLRLWLVTHNSQAVEGEQTNPAQSALWGLGAAIVHELPELNCTRVDLSAEPWADIPALVQELGANDSADQIALRGERRSLPRLMRYPPPLSLCSSLNESYRIVSTQPGIIDNLIARAMPRRKPGAGQIEMEVRATGLNFMNVMSALGSLPGYPDGLGPLGIECAGVVTAVGADVLHLRAGDEILGIAFDCLGTHALTDARLVLPKPAELSFEQAATIPIAFLTAWYALERLACLQKSEGALIHAATGGVGLAAIQIARHLGAQVFATVGSSEKREYLERLGIQNIFDSRSLSFADKVMARTNGRGVDVVLNSLAGEAVTQGLGCLAPYGRFLEIGKRDIYQDSQLGLLPFQKNLSYFAIDLERMARERPDFIAQMFGEIMDLFAAQVFTPLPLNVYSMSQVTVAFRTMAQAKHIGKIVIVPGTDSGNAPTIYASSEFNADATYLITGGTGGLGLAVTRWMVERGARHLVLASTSGDANLSPDVRKSLNELDAQIVIAQSDVARESAVAALLAQIQSTMPPLRGVIHAAGVLDDGVLLQQTPERFNAVFAPKVQGAWHLHRLTQNLPLDFFVLFSSITSILGSPGQGNYSAANGYLDGLAHYRRALGLPALSINWGPWSQVGLAAQRGLQGLRGVSSISPRQGVQALARLMESDATQAVILPFDASEWCRAHPAVAQSTLFASLKTKQAEGETTSTQVGANLRDRLNATEPGRQRRMLLESFVQEQAAHVLRLVPTRIDIHKPLRALGLDSLMSIEFRNRLERALGVTLSATLVFNYPTIAEIVAFLAEKLGVVLEGNLADKPHAKTASSDLADLSDQETAALLAQELDEIDELLKKE